MALGEGSWSDYDEKVAEERDELERLCFDLRSVGRGARAVRCKERDGAGLSGRAGGGLRALRQAGGDTASTKGSKQMNERDFVYWLQGFLELREGDDGLSERQVRIIRDHVELVFNKVTPERKAEVNWESVRRVFGDEVLDIKTHTTC